MGKAITENGLKNPVRYAGEYLDEESGLYYLRGRYYNPDTMRFISEDSVKGKVGEPLTMNLYAYCGGNPIRYSDPTGHSYSRDIGEGGLPGPGISGGGSAGGKGIWDRVREFISMDLQRFGSKGLSRTGRILGEQGTQFESKTTWQNGKTERIDVENPSPGERPGQIHYHESDNTKWYFDIEERQFYNQKTGELAPRKIQNLLKDKNVIDAINKALKFLGEDKLK